MTHPSTRQATAEQREREFAEAGTRADVDRLQARWRLEDEAATRTADWRERELQDLRGRVARLEKTLGPNGKALIDTMVKALGTALGELRRQDRAELLAEVEQRGYVTYQGVWDEGVAYPRGSLVALVGAAWVALTPAEKGLRPGKAPAWRLAVKGGDAGKVTGA